MENNLINFFSSKLKSANQIKLAFPEKDDRVKEAKSVLSSIGLELVDINSSSLLDNHIELLKKLKFSKDWPTENLIEYLNNPFIKSLVMLKNNEINGVVCGCTMPSSDIIRNSIRIIGLKERVKWLSSMFLMISEDATNMLSFSDCAVIPEPSPEQLCDIAKETSRVHEVLVKKQAKVAFLSFSTKGSADHYRVKNVRKAVKLFSKKNPKILHDGEIQLDAAIDPIVSNKKNDNSQLKGDANILIFPNLDAGNIGYKLVQKFGKYYACGPLLLGLNSPVNDLSRGATVDDIILIGLITALQAEKEKYADV